MKLFGKFDGGGIEPKPIFAVDADCIIFLSKIAYGHIEDLEHDYRNKPQLLKILQTMWKNVYYGQIELVITPSVLSELGFSEATKQQYNETMLNRDNIDIPEYIAKFVRSFCTTLLEPEDEAFEQKIINLAEAYCKYAGFDYLFENGIIKPCKDAFNLAQAVYFGLPFLTGNSAHFIEDVVGRNGSIIHKLEKIIEINTKFGYIHPNEKEHYKTLEPISIWHLFPDKVKTLPTEEFMDNFLTSILVKNLQEDEVLYRDRDYFGSFDELLYDAEDFEYSKVLPQTMLVLIDSEKSTDTHIEPSFIAFAQRRVNKEKPYRFKDLGCDIMFYRSEDADENGNINIDNFYDSLKVPRGKGWQMDTSSEEYKLYQRLLNIYNEKYANKQDGDDKKSEDIQLNNNEK